LSGQKIKDGACILRGLLLIFAYMNIGEQLQQARQALGWSIREASEATKIRGDVLSAFENNDFKMDLPDVYKRGFLRLYAKAIKLNAEEVLEQYALLEAQSQPGGKASRPKISEQLLKRELFGQMNLDEENSDDADEPLLEEGVSASKKLHLWERHKTLWIGILGGLVCVLLGLGIWSLFRGGGADEIPMVEHQLLESADREEQVTLIAKDSVYVVVRQESDRQKLFNGEMKKGERLELTKRGPIKIQYNQGENLLLERNGQMYSMSTSGLGVSAF
jgi:cytoskeleton protein RodZ